MLLVVRVVSTLRGEGLNVAAFILDASHVLFDVPPGLQGSNCRRCQVYQGLRHRAPPLGVASRRETTQVRPERLADLIREASRFQSFPGLSAAEDRAELAQAVRRICVVRHALLQSTASIVNDVQQSWDLQAGREVEQPPRDERSTCLTLSIIGIPIHVNQSGGVIESVGEVQLLEA